MRLTAGTLYGALERMATQGLVRLVRDCARDAIDSAGMRALALAVLTLPLGGASVPVDAAALTIGAAKAAAIESPPHDLRQGRRPREARG